MTIIETKEIGISIGTDNGRFVDTEIIDGSIRLKQISETVDGDPVYKKEGFWESAVIDTVDKFREYDKLAVTKTQFTNDLYKIETRTSEDGINFDPYTAITASGNIVSVMKRYIQVKITFYAGMLEDTITISNFDTPSDVTMWEDSTFIETDGVLKLKRDYQFVMTEDRSWSDEGYLFRKAINKDDWKKIDRLEIE